MSLLNNSFNLLLSRIIVTIVPLLSTPLYLSWVGKENYGRITFFWILLNYLNFLDIGLIAGAKRNLIEKHNLKQTEEFWHMAKTTFVYCLSIGLLQALIIISIPYLFPDFTKQYFNSNAIFIIGGFSYLVSQITRPLFLIFSTRAMFTEIVQVDLVCGIIGTFSSLYLTYLHHQIEFIMIGGLIGNCLILIITLVLWGKAHFTNLIGKKFAAAHLKQFSGFGLKLYFQDVIANIAGNIDKTTVAAYTNPGHMANFTLSSKPSETFYGLLSCFQEPLLPSLSQKNIDGTKELSKAFSSCCSFIMMMGCAGILIPSFCCKPLLLTWLGTHTPEQASMISALKGIFFTIELYTIPLTMTVYSINKPEISVYFCVAVSIAFSALTIPTYLAFDIIGVALLNIIINLIQLLPFVKIVIAKANMDISPYKHLFQMSKIFFIGLAFASIGYVLTTVTLAHYHPLIGAMVIPALSIPYLIVIEQLKLVDLTIMSLIISKFKKQPVTIGS